MLLSNSETRRDRSLANSVESGPKSEHVSISHLLDTVDTHT